VKFDLNPFNNKVMAVTRVVHYFSAMF